MTMRRAMAAGLALALVGPPLQVFLLRYVDPPFTPTLLARSWQHWRKTGVLRLPDYRWADLGTMPRSVAQAAVTSEDQRFLEHHGFDFGAIEKAWERVQDDEKGRLVGGSTITQQVARNVFLWQGRTWLRKGLEAGYTCWLELLIPKRRILEVYLNVAETGPMMFGVAAAARRDFAKPVERLSAEEAARIIACLPAPRSWTPSSRYVQRRADWIVRHAVDLPAGFGRKDFP